VTALDPETGELVGPASAIQALLDGDELVDDPALAAALAAARDPAVRIATLGVAPGATVLGDASACVLVTERPGGRHALLAIAPLQVPVALAVWIGLEPRPVPAEPAIRLDPGAMSLLIGRGEAHGHGLEPDVANGLQRRLEAGVRHWTVRVECERFRRNLEVVDGEAGIWRVRPVDGLIELAPTTTTDVTRALIALVGAAFASGGE
jgi:hypothetical protein